MTWTPISNLLELDPIPGGLLLVPSIIFVIVGLIWGGSYIKWWWKIVGFSIATIGLLGVSECIASGASMPDNEEEYPIMSINMYPVEYRPENNTLYVFKDGSYVKASRYTSEFITPEDTLYEYEYQSKGNNLLWGDGIYYTYDRIENVLWLDSLSMQTTLHGDTVLIQMGEDGMFEPVIETHDADSTSVE